MPITETGNITKDNTINNETRMDATFENIIFVLLMFSTLGIILVKELNRDYIVVC